MEKCGLICQWAKKQGRQASTWRGIAIGVGSLIAIVNPALGASVLKAVGVIVATIDVIKNDNKQP